MTIARRIRRTVTALAAPVVAAALLAGCQDVSDFAGARSLSPVSASMKRTIEMQNMNVRSPIMLRIFKEESKLEVWKQDRSGRMRLLKDYDICKWSGELGPKIKEGDRQSPEGFYTVTPGRMNPNSSYYLSFDLGFPNAFDRSLKRTGSHIMVHGDCSSRGCFAMEDEQVEEIYVLAREAFAGGQNGFQVQSFPFRMTPENMARHASSEHLDFWKMLKEGSDHFEVTQQVPQVDVCGKTYVFNAKPQSGSFRAEATCPTYSVEQQIEQLVAAKRDADTAKMETVVAAMTEKAERDRRWAERDAKLAALFGAGKETAATEAAIAAATGTTADPTEAAGAGAKPVATASPVPGTVAAVVPAQRPASEAAGSAVASLAGSSAAPVDEPAAASAVPSPALGYAAEPAPDATEQGFFDAVTKRSQGLFRRAGSLLN